jgi:hypothetical protein
MYGSQCSLTLSLNETCPYKLTNPSANAQLFKSVVDNSAKQNEANSISAYTKAATVVAANPLVPLA